MSQQPTLPTQEPSRSYRRRTVRERPVKRRTVAGDRHHVGTEIASGKRKREGAPNILRLSTLKIPSSLSKIWIAKTSIAVLVDYLLFERGLFPMTVADLRSNVGRSSGMYSSPTMQRKLKSATMQRDNFMAAWESASSTTLLGGASLVLISIGTSYGRGSESFLVDLGGLTHMERPGSTVDPPPVHVLARKLLPKLMEANLDVPSSKSPSLRLSVSLWLSQDQVEANYSQNGPSDSLAHHPDNGSQAWIFRCGKVLPTFRELQPKVAGRPPKKRLIALSLSQGDRANGEYNLETMKDDAIFDRFGDATNMGQWLHLSYAIKGFRI